MLEDILTDGLSELKLETDSGALRRFRIYSDYLEKINEVMNLTAIEGEDGIARLHFLDCLQLLKLADFSGKKVIDVGTGAGFPGLPVKIACPDIQLTLLDSLDKRIGFLKDTCALLGLEGVECIHARAEEIPRGYRESCDFALSRAVARLNLLSELCIPYVKPGGAFIAMKGPEPEEELNEAKSAISKLGAKTERVIKYTVPGTDITHSAIIIRKVSPTPAKYPRRWAQIKKQSL